MVKKQIPNWPDYYATSDGRIWSEKSNRFLKYTMIGRGYKSIMLCQNGKVKRFLVHRLVLFAFKGNCPKGMEGCHNDDIKTNNNIKNLRWDTPKNNRKDALQHGVQFGVRGENNHQSKLTEKDVRFIIYLAYMGIYSCRAISKIFDVNRSTIQLIANKQTWKHIWFIKSLVQFPIGLKWRRKQLSMP